MAPPKKTSPLHSFLVVILGLALLALLVPALQAIFGPRGHLEMNRELMREIRDIEAENEQVMEEVESLKTDLDYIEKIAREELGLIREGEIKVIIRPNPQDPGRDSSKSE